MNRGKLGRTAGRLRQLACGSIERIHILPHRSDQLEHLSKKTFRTLWTTRAEVEKHVEERVAY